MTRMLPRFLALTLLALALTACGSSEGGEGGDECPNNCLLPPGNVCDGAMLTSYSSPGACLLGSCQFVSTQEDCSATGGTCESGACIPGTTDPCDGVTCDAPPAATCEANVRVSFEAAGICDAGECSYTRAEQDCTASDQLCMEATCVDPVDPCGDITCNTPPAPACEANVAVVAAAEGVCSVDDAGVASCAYDQTETDCTPAGEVCDAGACVAPDPCAGIRCLEPPSAFCEGTEIVDYSALGQCVDGECEYRETRTDCDLNRLLCEAGSCVARPDCFEVVCDRPPAASCFGDTARVYDDAGTCSENRCSYALTEIDCAAGGEICEGGVCVPPTPCTGVECTTPPPQFCDGDTSVTFEFPGSCDDAVCRYGQINRDCAAEGGTCENGECEFDTSCEGTNCGRLPAARCEDDETLVEFFPVSMGPDCIEGRCQYDEVRTVCDDGELCLDGVCEFIDPCDFLTCITPDFCDGDVLVEVLAPGTCEDGVCDFSDVERRTDCTDSGRACRAGVCVTAAELLNVGDIALSEVFFEIGEGSPAQWLEIRNLTEGDLNIGGLIVRIDGTTELTLPDGVVIPRFGGAVVSTPGSDAEEGAALVTAFEIRIDSTLELVGTGVLDTVVFSASFVASDVTSTSLDPNADHLSNDDAASWCFSSGIYVPSGSPGEINSPCAALPADFSLVPTEIMAQGDFGTDGVEQYLEFFNASDDAISLAGARLDTGTDIFVIPPGVVAPTEGYVVLAAGRSMAGGSPDAVWGVGTTLELPEGEALLTYGETTLFSLEWDDEFPFVDGASVEYAGDVFEPEFDAGEFWCTGTADIPGLSPNLGSPGRAGDCPRD